jgi:hypothetical protein
MWLQEGGANMKRAKTMDSLMASVLKSSNMKPATIAAVAGSSLGVLNVAISGYTLYLMIARVQELEKQIEQLHEQVAKEFARDRQVDFETALESARDIIDAENDGYRHQAAARAIELLLKAKKHFLIDFNTILEKANNPQQLQQAQIYLLRAMLTDTMRIRCFLETNQVNVAKSRLAECVDEYLPLTKMLVEKLLGQYPALYFHGDVSDENLERFIAIQQWLRQKDDVLADLILAYRKDFWNNDAVKPIAGWTLPTINMPFMKIAQQTQEPHYLTTLTQCEILIENYQRLLGFELELASMRLTFEEWDRVADLHDEHDFVAIIDTDLLQAEQRLGS